MAFGFDPSIILSATRTQEPTPNETLQALADLRLRGVQQQQGQATLASLLQKQAREQSLADVYRQSGGNPDVVAPQLLRGGFGEEALAYLTQRAQEAALARRGQQPLAPEQLEYMKAKTEKLRQSPQAKPEKGPDPIKSADALRKEMNLLPEVKAYSQVKPYYQNLKAADEINRQLLAQGKSASGAGDLNFIFNFMKLLDPGVAVMEGDVANAQNAGGIPDKIRAQYNQAVAGGRLSAEQRADFMRQAEALYGTREKAYNAVAERYRGLASRRNASADDVAPMPKSAASKAGAASIPAGAPTRTDPATGETRFWNGTQWVKGGA